MGGIISIIQSDSQGATKLSFGIDIFKLDIRIPEDEGIVFTENYTLTTSFPILQAWLIANKFQT